MPTEKSNEIEEIFESKKNEILESFYLARALAPTDTNWLKYRSLIPDFFYGAMLNVLNKQDADNIIQIGKKSNWEFYGKKICVKTIQQKLFPEIKRGDHKKPTMIQLKNTQGTKKVGWNEFDYVLAIGVSVEEEFCSFALLTLSSIKDLLKNSVRYNSKCNENGYDDHGQIQLFLDKPSSCTLYVDADLNMIETFKNKYHRQISVSEENRNRLWKQDQLRAIKEQFNSDFDIP